MPLKMGISKICALLALLWVGTYTFRMPCSSSPSRAQAKRFVVFNHNKNFIGKMAFRVRWWWCCALFGESVTYIDTMVKNPNFWGYIYYLFIYMFFMAIFYIV
jgi:hypothetical protein